MNREIEYIVKIAECRSLSAAAAELFISQPALSKLISEVEARYSLTLFERTRRGVMLTSAGECYYKYALEVIEKERILNEEMEKLKHKSSSVLRVGMVPHSEQITLAQCIKELRRKYPQIELNITEQLSRDVEFGIRNDRIDIGLMDRPFNMEKIIFTPIGKTPMLLSVPRELLPAGFSPENIPGLPFPWADIHCFSGSDFILQDLSTRMRHYIDDFFRREHFSPQVIMTAQISNAALKFALQGIGVCIVTSEYIEDFVGDSRLSFYCIGTPPAFTTLGAVTKKDRLLSPAAQDFIRFYADAWRGRMAAK